MNHGPEPKDIPQLQKPFPGFEKSLNHISTSNKSHDYIYKLSWNYSYQHLPRNLNYWDSVYNFDHDNMARGTRDSTHTRPKLLAKTISEIS